MVQKRINNLQEYLKILTIIMINKKKNMMNNKTIYFNKNIYNLLKKLV